MKFLVFDTETTGFVQPSAVEIEKQPKAIELGLIVVENNKILEERNWLINPGESITDEITKITGIKNEDLVGKPNFGQLLGEIEDIFAIADATIAHNAPFDTSIINFELQRIGRTGFPWPKKNICTVQEYTHVFGRRPKLTELYEEYIGLKLEQTHRALDDVLALHEILVKDDFYSVIEMVG